MVKELYVLAMLDESGDFVEYVRKGRNNNIVGYDSLSSAKRGLAQSRAYMGEKYKNTIKIVRVTDLEIIESL